MPRPTAPAGDRLRELRAPGLDEVGQLFVQDMNQDQGDEEDRRREDERVAHADDSAEDTAEQRTKHRTAVCAAWSVPTAGPDVSLVGRGEPLSPGRATETAPSAPSIPAQ